MTILYRISNITLLLFLTLSVKSQNFQDTKGELSVSNSGTASYTIPIALPPSINGTAPVINLNYSSGARGGIAGQGWNVSGISSISRISTRQDIDGFRDGVDHDDNDKLALDGQRLILKSGTYWADGSTYETEYKSNIKIELAIFSMTIGGSISTKKQFKVTNTDGSVSWYGKNIGNVFTTAAKLDAQWFIVRHEDVYGNAINYIYANHTYGSSGNSTTYIDEITFSGNVSQSLAAVNKIKFNYKAAARTERDFVNGSSFYSFNTLDNIQVLTNNVQFRKYQLSHNTDSDGYDRVRQVQEFNDANEASNPVIFNNQIALTPTTTNRTEKTYTNNLNFSEVQLAGDFDGDGRLDFVANNQVYASLFTGNAGNAPIATLPSGTARFSASTMTNNKLNQFQSIVNTTLTIDNLSFNIYNLNGVGSYIKNFPLMDNPQNHNFSLDINRTGDWQAYANTPIYDECNSPLLPALYATNKFYEGDFDGDGISEVLVERVSNEEYFHITEVPFNFASFPNCYSCSIQNNDIISYYLFNLNQDGSTSYNTKDAIKFSDNFSLLGDKILGDYNGDGKSDFLVIKSNYYQIIGFKQINQAPWVILEVIGSGYMDNYHSEKLTLAGDFNGDGKTDIITPTSAVPNGYSGSVNWAIYYSNSNTNGADFFTKETHDIVEYWADTGNSYNEQRHWSTYYAMDVNKDGKSDLVRVWRKYYKPAWTINDHNTMWQVTAYTNKIGTNLANKWPQTFNSDIFQPDPLIGHLQSGSPDIPIPLAGNFKQNGATTDLVIVRGHYDKLEYYSFNKNFDTDNRLQSISESGGKIVHTIGYTPMAPSGLGLGITTTDIYSSGDTVTYPNIEIIKNPNNYLVSLVTATVNNLSKRQKFRYHGYVSNFVYGSIGFKRTARSSWYINEADSKIWTVEEIDLTKRGATTTTWSTTNGANVFAATPSDLLSTKTNSFSTYTFPNGVYNVLLNQQTSTDALTGVIIQKNFSYDGAVDAIGPYGLQTSSTTNYYNGTVLQGSSTTGTAIADYSSNPTGVGSAYFIGKPLKVASSTTINNIDGTSDTRTSEEKYTYPTFTSPNISRTEKKGHNTDYLQEDMTYDAVGNLLTKTVSMPTASPAIASRTITDEYEPTKRFVITKTDHQGFVTNLLYNPLGQVTQSTNYLGVVSAFGYDTWGKLTTSTTTGASTTALITTTAYIKLSDGGYTVTATNTQGDQAMSRTQYDVLGRVVKSTTKGFTANTEISKSIEYDALGRKYRESEPYFGTTIGKWTTINTYDYLHRPTQVTTSTGRVQTIAYAGLTTTSIDAGKTSTATVNAMGNKVSTTDNGGTITFNYFATGQLKTTNYDGNIISTEIDGWGNKLHTFDPNAGNPTGPNQGKYSYTYDAFGQVKTETTPKGTTTYTYDSLGKLITKKVLGDGVDFNIVYTYNAFAQLLTEINKTTANVDIDNHGYTYDSLHRLETTVENNANFNHTKTITFDTYGRMNQETNVTTVKGTLANNFASTVVTKYLYNANNGILYKMTDGANNSLWELKTANQKMQTLTAELGNGTGLVTIANTYTPDFYFATQQNKKGTTFIVNNTYIFDAEKGNLTSRNNDAPGMNVSEVFTYDPADHDRLKTWTNPLTGLIDFNNYDDKGRITNNNKLGTVTYNTNTATGIYRKDKIALNTEGLAYYNALTGNQVVSYNMFKSPIQISESGRGKCNFEYNAHGSRSKMFYDNRAIAPSTIASQRKVKLYTDDGSTEVIMDLANNTIKIITFVGGDAYSAVVYNEKLRTATGTITQVNNYLHRDYQGTIIAISNSAGLAIEKRAFDAWGNLAKLVNSANTSLNVANGLVVLDRGYTGHEHLQEVRLIHMNGRLYDPMLRSFLMPDNFVQQPENTQNYNRYSYVLNNPLRYTDPSGEEFFTALLIGAIISAATYTLTAVFADVPFSLGGLVQATFIGAASAAVTFGIGQAAGGMFTSISNCTMQQVARGAFQALAHGTFQGSMTAISGGKFWNGFAAGAASSLASSLFSFDGNSGDDTTLGWGNGVRSSGAGMIAFGTVAGGAGAHLSGGNFWQGAVTGLIVSGLNHAMHQMDSPDDNGYDKNGKKINNNGGDTTDTIYNDDGSVFSSTAVENITVDGGFHESLRGYGYKLNFKMATGAITEDNTIFSSITGGKVIGTGLSYLGKGLNALKVPFARYAGAYIGEFAPALNKGSGFRIGISKANIPGVKGTQMVFRATYGNNQNHFFNIRLGKWGG